MVELGYAGAGNRLMGGLLLSASVSPGQWGAHYQLSSKSPGIASLVKHNSSSCECCCCFIWGNLGI